VRISGETPPGLDDVTIDYTISMPGFILKQGQVTPSGGTYQISFDPAALHEDFPNLDLIGRDDHTTGLSDTFAIGLLLQGQDDGEDVYRANTITIQGQRVHHGDAPIVWPFTRYLPMLIQGG